MNTESIKACPFCGGEVEIKQTGKNELTIRCTKCLTSKTQAVLRYSLDWLREKLIEGWNARVEPAIEQSQSEQGYSEAFWEEIRERFRDHAKEHLHFTECDGRYKAGYSDAVDFSFEWFKSSLPQRGYSEAEVKELLRQQREKCARAYLDNFKNHGILNAPEPQLKSSVT
jgi:hypothetical protein